MNLKIKKGEIKINRAKGIRYEVRVMAKYGPISVETDRFTSEKQAIKKAKIRSSKDPDSSFFVKKITTETIWTSKEKQN